MHFCSLVFPPIPQEPGQSHELSWDNQKLQLISVLEPAMQRGSSGAHLLQEWWGRDNSGSTVVTAIAVVSSCDGVLADFVFPVSSCCISEITSIYSIKKYLLRACSEVNTVLDARDTEVNKTDIVPGVFCQNICKFLSLHVGPCKVMLQICLTDSIFLPLESELANRTVTDVTHSEA